MRAFVTGASGFVGRWLVAHLEASGDDVVAIGHDVDIVDGDAVASAMDDAEPTVVYHLAGQAHVGQSWDAPAKTFEVNALGTVNVLAAAKRCSAMPRVVVVSSAEVYGKVRPEQVPLTEDAPLAPVSPYAASKVAAEFAAIQAHLGWGVEAVIARPFNHIGPGQSPAFVVSALAERIKAAAAAGERTIKIGNRTPRRDLTDVRDVVRAYRLLAERGRPGEVYNVCTGRDVVIGDLAQRMIELASPGAPIELVEDPELLRPVDVPVLRGDPTKLRRDTGWEPDIPLDATLEAVLAPASAAESGGAASAAESGGTDATQGVP